MTIWGLVLLVAVLAVVLLEAHFASARFSVLADRLDSLDLSLKGLGDQSAGLLDHFYSVRKAVEAPSAGPEALIGRGLMDKALVTPDTLLKAQEAFHAAFEARAQHLADLAESLSQRVDDHKAAVDAHREHMARDLEQRRFRTGRGPIK